MASSFIFGQNASPLNDVSVEQQLCWTAGAALMRTQSAGSTCQRHFLRSDLAIGVLFQNPGSQVNWRLDGKLALDKAGQTRPSPTRWSFFRLAANSALNAAAAVRDCGYLSIQNSVAREQRLEALAKEPRVDGSWVKDRLAWTILSEIRKECANGFPRGPMFLESAAGVFVAQLGFALHGVAPRSEPSRALSDTKLAMVIEYIEGHLDRNVTLTELATLVDLSPRYFCAAFKEALGRPPHQFQIERRIERAKKLLPLPDMSLIDIALAVGFSSQSHLNDYFRRIVGVTPARYRAEVRPHRRDLSGAEYRDC